MNKTATLMKFLLAAVMTLSLTACFGGNVRDVKIENNSSDIYSKKDIESAVDTIVNEFDIKWDGCTLKKIGYAGDGNLNNYKAFAEGNDADEVIVLTSDFYVNSTGGDGSLNPDSTYKNWNWILVRKKDGAWKHVSHGYD